MAAAFFGERYKPTQFFSMNRQLVQIVSRRKNGGAITLIGGC